MVQNTQFELQFNVYTDFDETTMPGLVHKLVIVAAVDGLLLQPSPLRNQRSTAAIQISYRTNTITIIGNNQIDNNKSALLLEAHGIVGTFSA